MKFSFDYGEIFMSRHLHLFYLTFSYSEEAVLMILMFFSVCGLSLRPCDLFWSFLFVLWKFSAIMNFSCPLQFLSSLYGLVNKMAAWGNREKVKCGSNGLKMHKTTSQALSMEAILLVLSERT